MVFMFKHVAIIYAMLTSLFDGSALANGRGLALNGKVEKLKIELNSTSLEFFFNGSVEIRDERGINFNFRSKIKEFPITWQHSKYPYDDK